MLPWNKINLYWHVFASADLRCWPSCCCATTLPSATWWPPHYSRSASSAPGGEHTHTLFFCSMSWLPCAFLSQSGAVCLINTNVFIDDTHRVCICGYPRQQMRRYKGISTRFTVTSDFLVQLITGIHYALWVSSCMFKSKKNLKFFMYTSKKFCCFFLKFSCFCYQFFLPYVGITQC